MRICMFQPMASTTNGSILGWSMRSRKASWWANALRMANGLSGPIPFARRIFSAVSSTAARKSVQLLLGQEVFQDYVSLLFEVIALLIRHRDRHSCSPVNP